MTNILITIINISVRPWFESKDDKSVKMRLEGDLTLVCGARGYPLKVEWKFKNETDGSVKPCIGKFELDTTRKKLLSVSQWFSSFAAFSRSVSEP